MNKNTMEGGEMIIGRKYSWKMNWRQDKLLSVEKRILENRKRKEKKNKLIIKRKTTFW